MWGYTTCMIERLAETKTGKPKTKIDYVQEARAFLGTGELIDLVSQEEINAAIQECQKYEEKLRKELVDIDRKAQFLSYDERGDTFSLDGRKTTAGQVIASKNFDMPIVFMKDDRSTQLRERYTEEVVRDQFTKKLNRELAVALAHRTEMRNVDKAKAYRAIAKREEGPSEQLGVIAENMMRGIGEMIAIDFPDLNLKVTAGNAYQDVEEKIDFILSTEKKIRGVGVETNEKKSFGIQFTTNTAKEDHKMEQIKKAKEHGVDVDDILYVSIEKEMLYEALKIWKKRKTVGGPWEFLPKEIREKTITELFKGIVSEEEIETLTKSLQVVP